MEALHQANFVRLARAELKRHVKAGDVKVAEILMGEIPDWLERMPLEELCNSIPRFSFRRYQRLAFATPFGLTISVGGLTERQREAAGEALGEWEADADHRRRAREHRRSNGAAPRRRAAA
jgi:hypothetical protein